MKYVLFALFAFVGMNPLLASPESTASLISALKPRQPNWRFEVVETFPQGNPREIQFYEPKAGDEENPVKKVFFHEGGAIQAEMDLIVINEECATAKEWNSAIVPHGARIDFSPTGQPLKIASYQYGKLDGQCKAFYPNGQVQNIVTYSEGLLVGEAKSFYEDGSPKEVAFYENGQLEGDVVQYHPNGNKAALFPHENGKPEGVALNWFPSGVLNLQRQFHEGVLHGDGINPALTAYDEQRNIIEVLNFYNGQPAGVHIRYHKNGMEAYRLNYKNGLKEGKEQFFHEDGTVLGEGFFKEGVAVGEHFRKAPNGTIVYQAKFDKKGALLEPVIESNAEGQKLRQFTAVGDKLEGPYFEWHENGTPKFEYNYAAGQYEGEQKEFYPSGQIKVSSFYRNQQREGLHEEWHENGILARRVHFTNGLKDGQMGEWFANGTAKVDAYFQNNLPDGVQSEWYEGGQLKTRAEFAAGLKQGWQREWSNAGDLLFEVLFEKDQMQGTALSWWDKDQVKTRFQFENGKKEGMHKWFYKNGTPERVVTFKNDLMEGELLSWYPDGAMQSVQTFHEGKPVGEHRTYFPKSSSSQKDEERLAHLLHYNEEGKLHGVEKTFHKNGKVQSLLSYDNGLVHGTKQIFDPQETLIEEATYSQGKLDGRFFQKTQEGRDVISHYRDNLKNGAHIVFYPPNAKGEKLKAVEAVFENDQIEGLVTEYSDKGMKIAETPYTGGQKEGTAKIFADATISITIEFHSDKRNGLMTHFFPTGAVYKETSYVDDLRQGEEKTYYQNGAAASVLSYENDKLNGLTQNWNEAGVLVFEAEYQDGLRHGIFNKYYEDGKPYLVQTFVYDKLEGEKRKYERDGSLTVSNYEAGELLR